MLNLYEKIGRALPLVVLSLVGLFLIWFFGSRNRRRIIRNARNVGTGDNEQLGDAFDGAPFVRPKTRGNVRANHVPAETPLYKWGNQLDVVMPNRIIKAKNNL